MHYADLLPYRVGDYESASTKNVGWLDRGKSFDKGTVKEDLVDKLLELTMFDLEQHHDARTKRETHPRSIIVHRMHTGGEPFGCPFCGGKAIRVKSSRPGSPNKEMILGLNEMVLPALTQGLVYCFPTLLYHYVTEHYYQPPGEFLDALEGFSMERPFDCQE
jgi:hypothetical protein